MAYATIKSLSGENDPTFSSVAAWEVRPPAPRNMGWHRPAAYCSLRAEPKPRPLGKEGGKRKRMEMQSLPLHPHVITSFLVVAFRCATSPNFCIHIRRVLFFYRTFFQRAVTAVFSKWALAPFCSGYTARYSGGAYTKMPRDCAHAPAAFKV